MDLILTKTKKHTTVSLLAAFTSLPQHALDPQLIWHFSAQKQKSTICLLLSLFLQREVRALSHSKVCKSHCIFCTGIYCIFRQIPLFTLCLVVAQLQISAFLPITVQPLQASEKTTNLYFRTAHERNKLAVIRDYILPNFLSQFCFSAPVHYPYCHLTDV